MPLSPLVRRRALSDQPARAADRAGHGRRGAGADAVRLLFPLLPSPRPREESRGATARYVGAGAVGVSTGLLQTGGLG